MARRPVPVPIVEALARRTDEYRRHLLLQSFAAVHRDSRELLMRGVDPGLKSKAMSVRMAQLEASWTGKPAPDAVELVPLMDLMKRAGKRIQQK